MATDHKHAVRFLIGAAWLVFSLTFGGVLRQIGVDPEIAFFIGFVALPLGIIASYSLGIVGYEILVRTPILEAES